jgi:nucleoid-associated protein YgaU
MTLTHTVRPGENLSSIANDYYGDPNLFAAIRDANPGLDPRRMRVGQTLRIPPMDDAVEERATPAPAATGTPGETHTVKPGETLTKIAADRLGRSNLWMDLYELNRDVIGSDPEALKVGMVLRLPG